ncbi:MAG: phosphoribosyltransferase family protein [Bdellovibrionia bacterium]
MLHFFLQCIGCEQPIGQRARSLCNACEDSLLTSPPLCSQCGSPVCPINSDQDCTRPWVSRINKEGGRIDSYSARYLMIGQGYTVLKKWKLHRGPVFDRQILISSERLLATWKETGAKAIIPIPQHFFRSWQMRGSPVDVIAGWVGASSQLPIQKALKIGSFSKPNKRQAQRTLGERLAGKRNKFVLSQFCNTLPNTVILIDDFMTTGRTLNEAAQTLKNAGVQYIHAFSLGVRTFHSLKV